MAKKKQKKPVKKQRIKNIAPKMKNSQALDKGFTIPTNMNS